MIDLTGFCSPDPGDNFYKPFTQGDYTYATDCSIILRVPKRGDVPVNTFIPVWNLGRAFALSDRATYKALEVSEILDTLSHTELRLGIAWFNKLYVEKLQSLPEVTVAHAGQLEAMPFRFSGGMGLLMPMRPAMKKAA